MTTQEKIEVMQAYADGKKIQVRCKTDTEWEDWVCDGEPDWNWEKVDYRIKPESTYRPYKDTEEMIADFKKRFNAKVPPYAMPMIWVNNNDGFTTLIVEFGPNHVWRSVVQEGVSMSKLFQDYTYLDGSPCGIKDESK